MGLVPTNSRDEGVYHHHATRVARRITPILRLAELGRNCFIRVQVHSARGGVLPGDQRVMDESQVPTPSPRGEAGRGKDARTGASRGGGGPAQMGNALEALRVASTYFVVLYHAALA